MLHIVRWADMKVIKNGTLGWMVEKLMVVCSKEQHYSLFGGLWNGLSR
jgi:hypothetical protein